MKWTQSKSLRLTRGLTLFFMGCVVACAVTLPWMLKALFSEFVTTPAAYYRALIGLWLCALCALPALVMLKRLLDNISRDRVFVEENVRLVRRVSWCCFILAAIYAGCGFGLYFGLLFIALMTFIGLILRVVKNVLAQAVELKNENDLTV